MKQLLYLIGFTFLFSCNGQESKNIKKDNGKDTAINIDNSLDKLLFCDNFDIRDGYYQIPDYGCVYDTKTNKLGNANVVIIPRTEKFQTHLIEHQCLDDIDCLKNIYKNINGQTIKEFKENFNAVVFLIDKKFLKKTEFLDQAFNPKVPYIINTYILENSFWKEGAKYKVNNEDDLSKMHDWEKKIIEKSVSSINLTNINGQLNNNNIRNKKWLGNYSINLSYGENTGMYDDLIIKITVKNDTIMAVGQGNQMGFKDLLSAKEEGNKLLLNHIKNLDGNDIGETMKPEFILIEKGGRYYIQSEWIDNEIVTVKTNLGYEVKKQ